MKLHFVDEAEDSVVAEFRCPDSLEGYPGWLHGGIISLALDSAMANCMFARGFRAVTAELSVRFRNPVATGRTARVSARIVQDMHPLYALEAKLVQDGVERANATGKFMVQEG